MSPFYLAAGLVVLLGCESTLGPPFQPVVPADDTALVYLYRQSHFVGGGVAGKVSADDHAVGLMLNGSYVPYRVRAGRHVFSFGTASIVALDVHAHETRYVEYRTSFGGISLAEVPAEQGSRDIRNCALMPGGYDGRDRL